MSSISYRRDKGSDYITESVKTNTQTAETVGHLPYRVLRLSLSDGKIVNDGAETETVTVKVVDGLEIARGTNRGDATLLDYNGTVTVEIDGAEHSVSISGGVGSLDYATTQTAPTTVNVQAVALDAKPVDSSDVKTIEVTQA